MSSTGILGQPRRALGRRLRRYRQALAAPKKKLYALGILSTRSLCLPDFLIIGAQKAGTTWLRQNLSHHPQVFMATREKASDPTELRYFDQSFDKPLKYYSRFFLSGRDRIKGDKSPNYCMLPLGRIRFIHSIMPSVRLVFMMRNPVERAWSHAVMNLVRLDGGRFEDVTESRFYRHFEKAKERGSYSAILDRWLSVFPSEQLCVGFYEDIPKNPKNLLDKVSAHIGTDRNVDWDMFPYNRVVNQGPKVPMPGKYRRFLEEMYGEGIEDLYRRFGSSVAGWRCRQAAG